MTIVLGDYEHVHFVGIGGIGMSALARYLLAQGYTVSGSDRAPGEQGAALQQLGARVAAGHRPENIDGAQLVVVTSAAAPDNPEVRAARERGLRVVKRAELLGAIANPLRSIAVSGTHGKTTTSGLIGHLLAQADLDPIILIGGISANLGSNARVGSGDLVVVEADEYDASFLQLRPRIAVILNVEPDHLDFYGSAERVHDAFRAFAAEVSDVLVVCADDPVAPEIAHASNARVLTYGIESGDWQAADVREDDGRTRFTVCHAGRRREYTTRLAGRHNALNALAAVVIGDVLDIPADVIGRALESFEGTERRCQVIGEAGDVLVIDDYGHHPSEIRTVLSALKERYRRPIRLVFQPHTYSRTKAFLPDFAESFSDANHVYLLDVYAARETDTLGVSGRDLAERAAQVHGGVTYSETMDRALENLLAEANPGDLVVTMGAGDVYRLAPRLLEGLRP